MSRYRIYRIDHADPREVGNKRRRLILVFAGFSLVLIIVYLFVIQILHVNFLIVYSTYPLILGFAFYLNSRLKAGLKKIRTIGEIEFTRSHIKKILGDIYVEYDFRLIKELELSKHIPGISPEDNKSGYFSYILKIVFKDSPPEHIVVSDRPIDKNRDLSIVETMKTLKKIIQPEITIKS